MNAQLQQAITRCAIYAIRKRAQRVCGPGPTSSTQDGRARRLTTDEPTATLLVGPGPHQALSIPSPGRVDTQATRPITQ